VVIQKKKHRRKKDKALTRLGNHKLKKLRNLTERHPPCQWKSLFFLKWKFCSLLVTSSLVPEESQWQKDFTPYTLIMAY